jgi:hypothetical protein
MILLLRDFIGWMVGVFGSREDLILENLALRQQLLALHSKRPRHYRPCTSCSGLLCETRWTSGRNHAPRFDTIRGQAFWLGYAFWVMAGLCFPGALLACDRSRTTEANAKARMVDSRDFQGREING